MKISHLKRYGNDGTVYRNTISMTQEEFEILSDIIRTEIAACYPSFKERSEGYAEIYLKNLTINNGICFLNITQARYLKKWIDKKTQKPIDMRFNTCIIIK
jgi:hypothetical protein